LFAAQLALAAGLGHAFAGPQVAEVGFELGDHGQDLQEQPAEGVFPVLDRGSQAEEHAAVVQVGEDGVDVGDVAGEAVELGDGENAAGPQRGQRLIHAGAVGAAGAGGERGKPREAGTAGGP
jgi:hypothetical protein